MSIDLFVLGRLEVVGQDGSSLKSVLAQPKRLALFSYLACAPQQRMYSRDVLLALFWPELSEDRARGALNQALTFLRREAGSDAIITRGLNEVGVDPTRVSIDARAFEEAVDRGERTRALEIYGGEFLDGLHVAATAEFEQWLDLERRRLRQRAGQCALDLVRKATVAADYSYALKWALRGVELRPHDDEMMGALVLAYHRLGDDASAIESYDAFARGLAADLELEPSDALRTIVHDIRAARQESTPGLAQRSTSPLHAPLESPGEDADRNESATRSSASMTSLRGALLIYAAAFMVVTLLTRVAIEMIGLPDWVFPGVLIVMALGLPPIFLTAFGIQKAHGLLRLFTWRRTAVGGVTAIGVFVAFVVLFMASRSLGIGPAGSLLAKGQFTAREPLIITDFRVSQTDTSAASVVAEVVRAGLLQSSVLTIVGPSQIADALRRAQIKASTRIDLPLARDIAARDGIKAIVDGDVTAIGAGFAISLRLVSAESGAEMAAYRTAVDGPKELLDAVDGITRKLRAKIGESLRTVHAAPPLSFVTTGSIDALRKFTEGSRAWNADNDQLKAISLFRQAVAIDTTFAYAWRSLGVAMNNVGMPRSEVDVALARAYRLRDHVTERDRDAIIAMYFANGPGRDRGRAIAAYESMLGKGDTARASQNLGALLVERREYARAEHVLRATIARRPAIAAYVHLVEALTNAGQFEAAQRALAEGEKRFQAAPLSEVEAYLRYNMGDEAHVELLAARERVALDTERQLFGLNLGASLALRGGRVVEGERYLAEARQLEGRQHREGPPLLDSVFLGWHDVWFWHKPARAELRVEGGLAFRPLSTAPPNDRPYFAIAALYAQADDVAKALALLARYDAEVRDTALLRSELPQRHALLGEIAMAQHQPARAIEEFRQADSLPDGPTACTTCLALELGRAYQAMGQSDSAITWFERFLATPRANRVMWREPRSDAYYLAPTYEQLGALYEARGDRTRAAAAYARFVELWKHADPKLQPRVRDARERLSRLRAIS